MTKIDKRADEALHTLWSEEDLVAYEAYRASRHGELRACTCGIAEANLNRHAEGCAYLQAIRGIDAGWYELVRLQGAEHGQQEDVSGGAAGGGEREAPAGGGV